MSDTDYPVLVPDFRLSREQLADMSEQDWAALKSAITEVVCLPVLDDDMEDMP